MDCVSLQIHLINKFIKRKNYVYIKQDWSTG